MGGGVRQGFLLSASSALPLASALNAALTYRNADKNVICDILHIHYYPLPTILPSFEPKFVPPILNWLPGALAWLTMAKHWTQEAQKRLPWRAKMVSQIPKLTTRGLKWFPKIPEIDYQSPKSYIVGQKLTPRYLKLIPGGTKCIPNDLNWVPEAKNQPAKAKTRLTET